MPVTPAFRRARGACIAVLAMAAVLVFPGPASGAQEASGIQLSVTPASDGLVDGQMVEVRAALDDPDATIASIGRVQICRPGITYTRDTFLPRGGNCPNTPFSTSGDLDSGEQLFPFASKHSALARLRIGTGTAEWTQRDTKHSLTCDATSPCLLVAELRIDPGDGTGLGHRYATQTLTYADAESPIAGCEAFPTGAPRSAGADRVLDIWAEVTRAYCEEPGSKGVVTEAPRAGEGEAMRSIGEGEVDVAYSAAGPSTPGFEASSDRPLVAVPIALNATVLATAGGTRVSGDPSWPEGLRRPYRDVGLTTAEMATLLGEGPSFFSDAHGPSVLARNAELGTQPVQLASRALALAFESAPTRHLTNRLDALAPEAWRTFPGAGGVARDPVSSFERSPIDFDSSLQRYSDLASFDKGVFQFTQPADPSGDGPLYAVTDLATARRLDLAPVRVQTAASELVGPTPEAITKGLETLVQQPDGTLAPDPTASASGAYPLVMVEYAFAPLHALYDAETCAPRAATQEMLVEWLEYLVGDGQQHLPEGFVPLPASLAAESVAAIANVGSVPDPAAATCGSSPPIEPPTPPAGDAPLPPSDFGSSAFDDGGFDSALDPGFSEVDALAAAELRSAEVAKAAAAAKDAEIELPGPFGIAALGSLGPAASVGLLTGLTSCAAFVTSGRLPSRFRR